MKKIILATFLVFALFACKSKSATSTKLDLHSQNAIKGNYTITSVSYPGSEYIKVNSFQLADSKCFEGSAWKFVPNNDTGVMTITRANCPSFTSNIKWFVNKEGEFVLKILDAGEKAKKVRDGYVLHLAGQTADSFQLVDKIDVAGKMTDVVYQFQKVK